MSIIPKLKKKNSKMVSNILIYEKKTAKDYDYTYIDKHIHKLKLNFWCNLKDYHFVHIF